MPTAFPAYENIEAPRETRYNWTHRDSLEYAIVIAAAHPARYLGVIRSADGETRAFAHDHERCGDALGWHHSRVYLVDEEDATVEWQLDLAQAVRLMGRSIDEAKLRQARETIAALA